MNFSAMQNFPEMSFDNLTLMQQATGLAWQNKALQFRVEELLAQKASSDAELERLIAENEDLQSATQKMKEPEFKPSTFFAEVLVPMVLTASSAHTTSVALTHLVAQT